MYRTLLPPSSLMVTNRGVPSVHSNGISIFRPHPLSSDSSDHAHYELNQNEFNEFGMESPHQTWETSFSNERLIGDTSGGGETII